MANTSQTGPTPSFSLFNKSKELVLANINTYGILLLAPFLLQLFTNIRSRDLSIFERAATSTGNYGFSPTTVGIGAGLGLVFLVLNVIITIMMYSLTLESAKGKKPTISELWAFTQKYGVKLFLLSIVMAFIIVLGFIALIVPGIILIGRLFLAPYVMIDKDMDIMDSLKESSRISKPYFGYVWGIVLVPIVLSLPAIVPFVGWIVAFALTSLYAVAPALRYLELKKLTA